VGAVLTVDSVCHRRGGREVLRIDALEVHAGERLGLLGLNGAGKTSLLRLLAGIDVPAVGEVRVDGVPTATGGATLRRRIAYAPQRPVLLSMSVIRNVELPLRYRRIGRTERRATAAAALARLGIEHLAERPAAALSAGEAQSVSLARALACDPAALLLDEPAGSLDAPTRADFFADVERALVGRPTTVVLVSHRAEEVVRLADRVAVLVAGDLRQVAPADELVAQPADPAVARLVGYENVFHVEINQDGTVLLNGQPTGVTAAPHSAEATLAAWATAVELHPLGVRPLVAAVRRVTSAQGRHDVALDAGTRLHAHLPLDSDPPAVGTEVAVDFNPALVRLLDRHDTRH
jgi:ABC-type sulfate/molybdate transport systems ATPase subunit